MRSWAATLVLSVSVLGCIAPGEDRSGSTSGACQPTGCSGEVCSDQRVVTPCLWRPAYACYPSATCERQDDGVCGWTATPELTSCLASK